MKPAGAPQVEIETIDALLAHLAAEGSLAGVVVQSVDLSDHEPLLRGVNVAHSVFLGCPMAPATAQSLRARGAIVFTTLPDLPFNPYRATLYTPAELYDGLEHGYAHTPDAGVYQWWQANGQSVLASLAMALHDHAMQDALDELELPGDHPAVGIMGGHAIKRGSTEYRAAAALAARLAAAGRPVMTGGGPGAMEAANLGARVAVPHAPLDAGLLSDACDELATVPTFADADDPTRGISRWAQVAFEVLRELPTGGLSVGIPTWFYGHEPPNPFASQVAKYFSNAIREDTLLWRCRGGIIYLPGAAGTVQEIFQAATGNYYAGPGPRPAPMVLVGRTHWTQTLPAWPLLQALGAGRPMGEQLFLVDSIDEAAEVLVG